MNVKQNYTNTNRPFPIYLVPLCQSKALRETIHMKVSIVVLVHR